MYNSFLILLICFENGPGYCASRWRIPDTRTQFAVTPLNGMSHITDKITWYLDRKRRRENAQTDDGDSVTRTLWIQDTHELHKFTGFATFGKVI